MSGPQGGKAVFLNSTALGGFSFSPEHPFKPERLARLYRMCQDRGLFPDGRAEVVEIEVPEEGVLERFHTADYIEVLKRAGSGRDVDLEMLHHGIGSAENPVFKGLHRFAALSATASLEAARRVAGGASTAFNPCGGFHHAYPDRASGFCYANDVVIAIEELRHAGERVAYLDLDAHHGDAVQKTYYDDPSVLTISMHESGKTLFPWGGFGRETGEGPGRGFNINLPMESGADDDIFMLLVDGIVLEALRLFEPDVVVGQFGADMLAGDPLTHLRLTNNGYIEAVRKLLEGFPRVVALGGGGYSMDDTVRAWTLLWVELAGLELEDSYGGAMGGVFLGDSTLESGDLRDMHAYTTGPAKARLGELAVELTAHFERAIRPYLE